MLCTFQHVTAQSTISSDYAAIHKSSKRENGRVGLNIFPYKHPTEVKQNYGYKSKIITNL
jgi:hypothetical protein